MTPAEVLGSAAAIKTTFSKQTPPLHVSLRSSQWVSVDAFIVFNPL